MAWRYIELKSLEEAGETEEVCACYPDSNNNTSGYKHEEHMKIAEIASIFFHGNLLRYHVLQPSRHLSI